MQDGIEGIQFLLKSHQLEGKEIVLVLIATTSLVLWTLRYGSFFEVIGQ